jgi:mono/diheme cytochrome c family protein
MQLRLVAAALRAAGLYAGISILIPLSRADDAYSGGDPKRGEQVFSNNGCGWCHEGMGSQAGRGPALMNTTRTNVFLATRIMNGKPGSMPAFAGNLDGQQLDDLIAFIHSIKPEGTQ